MTNPIKLRKEIIKSLETCSIQELEYVLEKKKEAVSLKIKKITEKEEWINYYSKKLKKKFNPPLRKNQTS